MYVNSWSSEFLFIYGKKICQLVRCTGKVLHLAYQDPTTSLHSRSTIFRTNYILLFRIIERFPLKLLALLFLGINYFWYNFKNKSPFHVLLWFASINGILTFLKQHLWLTSQSSCYLELLLIFNISRFCGYTT